MMQNYYSCFLFILNFVLYSKTSLQYPKFCPLYPNFLLNASFLLFPKLHQPLKLQGLPRNHKLNPSFGLSSSDYPNRNGHSLHHTYSVPYAFILNTFLSFLYHFRRTVLNYLSATLCILGLLEKYSRDITNNVSSLKQ